MGFLRFVRAAALVFVVTVSWSLMRGATPRIVGAVDAGTVVTLQGNVSPRVAGAKDLGVAPGDRALPLMSLRFNMTTAQQAALTQLIADQQNPASARYHQWLTPEQFGAQFGLAAEDLTKVSSWLSSQGFTVTNVARGGLFVQFSGTVQQASAAFHTEIHTVSAGGETHIANLSAPSLPKAIADVTLGIAGLDDFRANTHAVQQTVTGAKVNDVLSPRPEYTQAGSHYLSPADFYLIYNEGTALQAGTTGSGVTVAVVGQTDIYPADIAAFQTAANLPLKAAAVTLYGSDPGYTTSADLIDAELGIEWAGAVAPGASILYVNSIDAINGSLTLAIDNNVASIIADSYGDCENSLGALHLQFYTPTLEMAATEGITITAPSGQYGSTDCDAGVATASQGLVVDFPASSPFVTGLGGTEFNEGSGSYWSSTNGAYGQSATGYIPEKVWNDDGASTLAASGGGASQYFSKPSWQTGTGVPNDGARDVPDVSLNASPNHDGYLICTQGYCSSGFVNGSGALDVVGGTAVASPAFAGLLALVEQKTGARIGVANPAIYALANSSYATSVFHDITTGTNASPCTSGTTNCPNGGTIGYSATAGYDQATGWGSVNATNLVNDWSLVSPLITTGGPTPTYTNLSGNLSAVYAGALVNFTATVASASTSVTTTPTGPVLFTVDNVAVGSAVSLSGGTVTYSLNTASLSTGTHTVQASYLGDTNFQGSRASFTLTIEGTNDPTFTMTPATASVTTAAGTVAPAVVLTVTSVNGFSGTVSFAIGSTTAIPVPASFTLTSVTISPSSPTATTALSLFAYEVNAKSGVGQRASVQMLSRGWYGSGLALAGLLMLVLPRRHKLGGLLLGMMFVAALGLSGCTSTPSTPKTSPITPTPAGTYTATVDATGTVNGVSTTQSTTVTLVVQ